MNLDLGIFLSENIPLYFPSLCSFIAFVWLFSDHQIFSYIWSEEQLIFLQCQEQISQQCLVSNQFFPHCFVVLKLLYIDTFISFFFFYCGGFCHTLKWNSHGFTCVPHPDPPSHLPLHPIPLGFPSAPGPSACLMHPTWAGDLFHPR